MHSPKITIITAFPPAAALAGCDNSQQLAEAAVSEWMSEQSGSVTTSIRADMPPELSGPYGEEHSDLVFGYTLGPDKDSELAETQLTLTARGLLEDQSKQVHVNLGYGSTPRPVTPPEVRGSEKTRNLAETLGEKHPGDGHLRILGREARMLYDQHDSLTDFEGAIPDPDYFVSVPVARRIANPVDDLLKALAESSYLRVEKRASRGDRTGVRILDWQGRSSVRNFSGTERIYYLTDKADGLLERGDVVDDIRKTRAPVLRLAKARVEEIHDIEPASPSLGNPAGTRLTFTETRESTELMQIPAVREFIRSANGDQLPQPSARDLLLGDLLAQRIHHATVSGNDVFDYGPSPLAGAIESGPVTFTRYRFTDAETPMGSNSELVESYGATKVTLDHGDWRLKSIAPVEERTTSAGRGAPWMRIDLDVTHSEAILPDRETLLARRSRRGATARGWGKRLHGLPAAQGSGDLDSGRIRPTLTSRSASHRRS